MLRSRLPDISQLCSILPSYKSCFLTSEIKNSRIMIILVYTKIIYKKVNNFGMVWCKSLMAVLYAAD